MTKQLGNPPMEEAGPHRNHTDVVRRGLARFPLAPLVEAMRLSENQAFVVLGISGSTAKDYRSRGVTARVADRLAVRAGFHPLEIWPELLQDALDNDPDVLRERRNARRRERHRNAYWAGKEQAS